MSKFIKKGFLQPGNYTISMKNFMRVVNACEKSGFDESNPAFAENSDIDELLFECQERCCLVLKNNNKNEEENLFICMSELSGLLYSENYEPLTEDEESFYFEDELRPNQVIAKNFADEIPIEEDGYIYEEQCPEGLVEKTFEITEPLDLSETLINTYESPITGCFYVYPQFPVIGKITDITSKGDNVKKMFSIDGLIDGRLSMIKEFLSEED